MVRHGCYDICRNLDGVDSGQRITGTGDGEISSSLSTSRTIPCTATGYVDPAWVQPSALPHMLHDPSARRAAATE